MFSLQKMIRRKCLLQLEATIHFTLSLLGFENNCEVVSGTSRFFYVT